MGLVTCQLFKNWISGHFPLFCSLCSRILQKFYTAALACFDKRIQWKNQINCVMYVLKMVSFFTPDFSALSQYRREERRGISGSGHWLTRSILSKHAPSTKVSCKKLWGFFSLIMSFLQAFYSLSTGSYIVSAVISSAVYRLLRSVLACPDKHSRPHSPKTVFIRETKTLALPSQQNRSSFYFNFYNYT